ncbi:MAG: hypothetical protein FWC41_07520 [Firmicutes bacterium]|nr:hypothetical protein [Bacillota bacterium]
MKNEYKQKLSRAEQKQLEAESESYQQIIDELIPITQELQASIDEINPHFNEKKAMIDFEQTEIEATRFANDFINALISLYIKDTNKQNAPYFLAKKQNDIFTLTDLYEQIFQNKAISAMMFYDINNAEKKHPRTFEVLSKHQQMRSETTLLKVRLENEMTLSWHNVVALYDTLQQLDEVNEIAEGYVIEDENIRSTIATHQDIVKRLKEKH